MSLTPRIHAISWFEMAVVDFDRALRFYSTILGTSLTEVSVGDARVAMFPSDPATGIGGSFTVLPGVQPGFAGTLIYLNVDGELAAVLERIPAAGGKVIRPPVSLGEQGATAVIADTEGNIVGLHSTTT